MAFRFTGEELAPDLLANAQWKVIKTAPGAVSGPDDLATASGWIEAAVPGTAAGALRDQQGEESARSADIDAHDWWWRTRVPVDPTQSPWFLEVMGLATLADVWVNGELVLHAENMFRSHVVELWDLGRSAEVAIRCAATLPAVTQRLPRPRWRSPLVQHQGWRWQRTSLLGRIEGWGKGAPPVGPWRPVRLYPGHQPLIAVERVDATLDGTTGIVHAEFRIFGQGTPRPVRVHVGDEHAEAHGGADSRTISAVVRLPGVQHWWPYSHGAQPLYRVRAEVGEHIVAIRQVGFRRIRADTEDGRFELCVNEVPVFIRGACWMPLDPVSLQAAPEQVREAVSQARDGGLNMLRIPGTCTYENESFYAACDELGMLVWQDCMLANLDPPTTPEFTHEIAAEVGELSDRLAGHPCLAVAGRLQDR